MFSREAALSVVQKMFVHLLLIPGGLAFGGQTIMVPAGADSRGSWLRWYNVEGAPFWVDGPKPRYSWSSGLHYFEIDPGCRVRIRLPGGTLLRLRNLLGESRADDVHVWYSDGSGLQQEGQLVPSTQGESLFLHPLEAKPRIVEVWRRQEANGPVCVAFFLSKVEFEDREYPFRRYLVPEEGKARIAESGAWPGEAYWHCPGGKPLTLRTAGPTKLKLLTRLCYDPEESRISQSYSIRLRLDGNCGDLRFETLVDASAPYTVDSAPRILGLERKAYFEVLDGDHDLEIQCQPNVYWQLLRCDSGNMLLDGMECMKEAQGLPQGLLDMGRLMRGEERLGFSPVSAGDGMLSGGIHDIFKVLGRSVHVDDGLVAGMYCRGLSASLSTHPEDRAAAQSFQSRYTRFRNVFPIEKKNRAPQLVGLFTPRRLVDPAEAPEDLWVPRRQLAQALKGVIPGVFFLASRDKESSQQYRIPRRFAPSVLRIVVAHGGVDAKELQLEFDSGEGFSFRALPSRELPVGSYQAGRADGALSIVRGLSEPGGEIAWQAALESLGLVGRIISAGTAEAPLPQSVETVRIWGKGGPWVALQYLAESPLELTEMEARVAEALDDSGENALVRDFRRWTDAESVRAGDGWDFSPSRAAMLRFLSQSIGRFSASVVAPVDRRFHGKGVLEQMLKEAVDAAETLESSGDRMSAFEKWSQLVVAPDPRVARLAKLKRIDSLQEIGEHYLMEMQLRGICLHDPDVELRREGLERLVAMYQSRGEIEALVGVLSTFGIARGQAHLIPLLARALAENGQHEMAQEVCLGLPKEIQPLDLLLKCALKNRWLGTFESLLERVESRERNQYWQGLEALAEANPERALAAFREAGSPGKAWASHLEEGLRIRSSLQSADMTRISSGIFEWESWQAKDPGEWLWVEDHESVLDHAGVLLCFSEGRNLFETYYKSLPGRPVRLRVAGPVSLRMEARPLHAGEMASQIQGWILVRGGAWLQVAAINNNLPSRELRLLGHEGVIPGTKVEIEVSLGPGIHDLQVSSEEMELILRILLRSPEFPSGVLPRLTPHALTRALGITAAGSSAKSEEELPSLVTCMDADGAGHNLSFPVRLSEKASLGEMTALEIRDPFLAARLALRLGSMALLAEHAAGLREASSSPALPVEERLLAMARLAEVEGSSVDPAALSASASPALRAMMNLFAGNLSSLIPADEQGSEEELIRKLGLCLYVKEHAPGLRKAAEARGEAIFRTNPRSPGLQSLFSRLVSDTDWGKISFVHESAGLREITSTSWIPESPELRVRHAMLPEIEGQDRRIMGDSRLCVLVSRRARTTLRCDCTLEAVDFLPAAGVNLVFQLDDELPQKRALLSGQPAISFEVTVPEGEHVLRFWQEDPVTNQGVRVQLREQGKVGVDLPVSSEQHGTTRQYYIATREKPLRFTIEGPTWIRIDELRGKETLVRYREVPRGWNDFELAPELGQEEALFRIFQRIPGAKTQSRIAQPPVPSARAMEPTPFSLLDRQAPTALMVDDVYAQGGQEDGTTSLMASLQRRRAFDEDDDLELDHYLELRGTHRYLSLDEVSHFRTDLLTRIHEDSGPTLGIAEDFHYKPSWLPFTLRLEAEGFLQWPQAPESGSHEWSATGRASFSRRFPIGLQLYHRPSLAAFGRLLSLDDAGEYHDTVIDQDVFTTYKSDHRAGLVVSEQLGYRPWLDTEIRGRVSLTSNEDFNPVDPDHVSAWVGWRQFFRGLEVDLGYKAIYFFGDSDRENSLTRHTVSLDILYDLLLSPKDRLELGINFQHDFTADEDMGFLFLAWHFSGGRHYRDYWPGDLEFKKLREERIPAAYNNSIHEVQP